MRNKWRVIVLAFTLLLGACSGGGEAFELAEVYANAASTDLSAEKGGLSGWDVTQTEIREQRGKPVIEGTTSKGEDLLEYEGHAYFFYKGKLQGYSIKQGGKTAGGIGIGDDRDRMEQQYGSHFTERTQDGLHFLGYYDKENGIVLEFVLKDEKVETALVMKAGGK
ncbi:hypothetical protein D3P07_18830 [Paenibacillus sp. 1011MAR3C5]|uniref:hypothetical protein n=1 Tax=Paenibacillus sp. 1011MAR3C5 TaxID=1675787 RepID=UPI000E6B9DA3|nr:hypothetical protein [Paenibacillus sp. 1011MAR3C5]RJE86138.1 hypothetical protein D3P07_18830 [Paenibacillus sp. 1011MAR3C5]